MDWCTWTLKLRSAGPVRGHPCSRFPGVAPWVSWRRNASLWGSSSSASSSAPCLCCSWAWGWTSPPKWTQSWSSPVRLRPLPFGRHTPWSSAAKCFGECSSRQAGPDRCLEPDSSGHNRRTQYPSKWTSHSTFFPTFIWWAMEVD